MRPGQRQDHAVRFDPCHTNVLSRSHALGDRRPARVCPVGGGLSLRAAVLPHAQPPLTVLQPHALPCLPRPVFLFATGCRVPASP